VSSIDALIAQTGELGRAGEESFVYIENRVAGVTVLSAMLNERVDPGNVLTPCMDVGWSIDGLPGIFFCHPKYVAAWPDIATGEIEFKKAKILAIYDGLTEAPWLVGNTPPPNVSGPGFLPS
jgi:hypothetical protein